MKNLRFAALALIVAGILALAYGGFSYTRSSHEAKLGPIEFTVQERETVNIPVWAGAGAIFAGVLLLVLGPKT
jgi:hypothetical protein